MVGVPGLDPPGILGEHGVVGEADVADVGECIEAAGEVDEPAGGAGFDGVGEHAGAVGGERAPAVALEAEVFHHRLPERNGRLRAASEQQENGEHGFDGIGTRRSLPFR